eukprot:TRINITY_DN60_c0_g1_i1.p1 TRINITY_DN60_c0_g1~~TRINITY_DN60_c0_g1_i1.p1  ORF type:complete len:276 (+),score=26.76 TRINITY_DN60_c0_g1_i1:29-829(+)
MLRVCLPTTPHTLFKLASGAKVGSSLPGPSQRLHCIPKLRSLTVTSQGAMGGKIQLYSFATPNGQKLGLALEELGVEYDAHTVNIGKGDQFKPEFVAINPNSKIPAITDPNGPDGEPIQIFESGAILLYLGEKTGKLLPADPRLKWETIQWVFFQMAGVGPMFGQYGHFGRYAKDKCDHPYPLERYRNEARRLLQVLEERLKGRTYLVGEQYTIADIASFPWVNTYHTNADLGGPLGFDSLPNVVSWLGRINARPATPTGLKVCAP